jgi:dTDP-4-dehydrorhamnose 3,5-epimerase
VAPLPDGVVVRPLRTHVDARGSIMEAYDPRWGVSSADMVYAYAYTILPGRAKGWGLHREHDDRYVLLRGRMEIVFWDARDDSPTHGLEARLTTSEYERSLIIIPAGVWHANRNIGESEVIVLNLPTTPYDHVSPDKFTLPLDTDKIPVRLGPDWVGF